MIVSHWIPFRSIQYDPNRDRNRNLYYHYLDEQKPDKFIAKIPKAEADEISFKISNDHRYLILCDSQALHAANVESLEQEIQFKVIFKITENITYVSRMDNMSLSMQEAQQVTLFHYAFAKLETKKKLSLWPTWFDTSIAYQFCKCND